MSYLAAWSRYFREHPTVLSNVIERMLSNDSGGSISWAGRAKRGEKRTHTGPFLIEDLPPEVGTTRLVDDLASLAARDPDAFLALIQLALVNHELHDRVRAALDILETRVDVVALYGRGAFDIFGHDDETFFRFLARLRIYAPACYRAWLLIARHERIRDKARRLIVYARDENEVDIYDDFATWTRNGVDPLASLVALHFTFPDKSSFERDDIAWLMQMVGNKELALVLQPLDPPAAIIPCPISNFEGFMLLAAQRCQRERDLFLKKDEELTQLLHQLLDLIPDASSQHVGDDVPRQVDYRNLAEDTLRHESHTLVDTLWSAVGSQTTLAVLQKHIIEKGADENRQLHLIERWMKREFLARGRGRAFLTMRNMRAEPGDLVLLHTIYTELEVKRVCVPRVIARAFLSLGSRPCFPSQEAASSLATKNAPILLAHFLASAISHGNIELVRHFSHTFDWNHLSNVIAQSPEVQRLRYSVGSLEILTALLSQRFVRKFSRGLSHNAQADCFKYLLPWFQRIPFVMNETGQIIPAELPIGYSLCTPELFHMLAQWPVTPGASLSIHTDDPTVMDAYVNMSLGRMNLYNIVDTEKLDDGLIERLANVLIPPNVAGDERKGYQTRMFKGILRVALTLDLEAKKARYLCNTALSELTLEDFAEVMIRIKVPCQTAMVWYCLRSDLGKQLIEMPDFPVKHLPRAIANPLIFLGQLRRHVDVNHRGYLESVRNWFTGLLFLPYLAAYEHRFSLEALLFDLRNALMPFFVDDSVASTGSDIFVGIEARPRASDERRKKSLQYIKEISGLSPLFRWQPQIEIQTRLDLVFDAIQRLSVETQSLSL